MSRNRSDSNHSNSSSNTTASANTNENSNVLYNDREHYNVIFENDSRFFDTSLHLFKTYRQRGYVPSSYKKNRGKSPHLNPSSSSHTLRSTSNGGLWRSKQIGFNSTQNVNGVAATPSIIKPQFQRNQGKFIAIVFFSKSISFL